MRTKLIALVALICMLFTETAITMAAVPNDTWNVKHYGAAAEDKVKYCADITTERKFDGEYSMVAKYPGANADINVNYMELVNPLSKRMESGRYILTVYNANSNLRNVIVSVAGRDFTYDQFTLRTIESAPSGETGWTEYSLVFDYEEQEESYLKFRFQKITSAAYLDNISLVKEGEEENIICDSGFEDYYVLDDGEDEEYEISEYQPQNILLTSMNHISLLHWINPSSAELTDIKVYDITDGNEILLSDEISVTPSERVYYKRDSLEEGKQYQYKVIFSYKGKEDMQYFLGGKIGDQYKRQYWTGYLDSECNGGETGAAPVEMNIDTSVSHTGEASMKWVSNIDYNIPVFAGSTFEMFRYNTYLPDAGKYYISYWLKGEDVVSRGILNTNMNWKGMQKVEGPDTLNEITDWTKFAFVYDYQGDGATWLYTIFEGMATGLWLDDIEVYKMNDDGTFQGDNLAVDGSFENCYSMEKSNLKVTAESGENRGVLHIDYGANTGAKIYHKINDNYEYRGILTSTTVSLALENLAGDREYEYRLVPFNIHMYEGDPVDISFTPSERGYKVSDIKLYRTENEGTTLDKIDGSGAYTISVNVKNTGKNDIITYEQIVAVYDGIELVGLFSTPATTVKKYRSKTTKTDLLVPEGENISVKFFLLNSRAELQRMIPTVEF